MKANLLVFCDEGNSEFLEHIINYKIMPAFCSTMQEISSVSFLALQSSIQEITHYLCDSTIIAVGFCEENCYRNIKIAVNNYYDAKIFETPFGEFCRNGNRFCSIIDLSRSQLEFNNKSLQLLYDVDNIFSINIFVLDKFTVIEKLKYLDFINYFDYTLHSSYGEIQLCFHPVNEQSNQYITVFKRVLYSSFDRYIYSDELKTLSDCVEELSTIRRQYFAVYDLVSQNFINQELLKIKGISNYLVQIEDIDFEYLNSVEETNEILAKYNLDFVILVLGNYQNIRVLVIDSTGLKKYEYSVNKELKYNQKYLLNCVLFKIFTKLHKNTLYF